MPFSQIIPPSPSPSDRLHPFVGRLRFWFLMQALFVLYSELWAETRSLDDH